MDGEVIGTGIQLRVNGRSGLRPCERPHQDEVGRHRDHRWTYRNQRHAEKDWQETLDPFTKPLIEAFDRWERRGPFLVVGSSPTSSTTQSCSTENRGSRLSPLYPPGRRDIPADLKTALFDLGTRDRLHAS